MQYGRTLKNNSGLEKKFQEIVFLRDYKPQQLIKGL